LPHVCSLSLLPAGACEHVPAAVQHLMVEGSPVYDMYASCPGCEEVGGVVYAANCDYVACLDALRAVTAEVQALSSGAAGAAGANGGTERGASTELHVLLQQQEQLLAEKQRLLALLKQAQEAQARHEAAEHPGGVDSFDLERLEAAVAAVPAQQYRGDQAALSQLTDSMLFHVATQPLPQVGGSGSGGYGSHQQQQQQQRAFSSSSAAPHQQQQQQATGRPRPFAPPPPPAYQCGPPVRVRNILRYTLTEDAHGCSLQVCACVVGRQAVWLLCQPCHVRLPRCVHPCLGAAS
jgi:hypothetical protein